MSYSGLQALIEKQHACNGCGCVFRYVIDPADWRTPLMSQTTRPRDSVRIYPCPDCGLYQPEMVMWLKLWHATLMLVGLLVLPVLAAMGLTSGGASAVLAAQIGVGVYLALALVHASAVFHDPNADREANLAAAKQAIRERRLERVTSGTPGSGDDGPPNLGFWHVPALLTLLVGPAAFVLVVVQLSDQPALPINADLVPSVVTPGQKVCFTFNKSTAQGVTGNIWRGTPTVRVQNARALGVSETLPAEGGSQHWGDSFSVSRGAGNQAIKPTISFTLPNDERLSGQTLRLAVTMQMTYPVMHTSGWRMQTRYFTDSTSTMSDTIEVKLANTATVAAMQRTFVVGLGGAGVSVFGAAWLAALTWMLIRHSSKSEVVSEEPMPESEPECAPGRPSEYGSAGRAGRPALDDFDRSKWGERKLR